MTTTITSPPTVDADALARVFGRLAGSLLLPGDEGYDDARAVYNTRVDQHPELLALPQSGADVVALVDFAREQGPQITTRRWGG